jgi:hypothetical protein
MLTVATYWWNDPKWPNLYGPEDIRLLQRQVKRNLGIPHRFACITDDPSPFSGDQDIKTIKLDRTKYVPGTCYARLMTFHPNGQEIFGERLLTLDIDAVITGPLNNIVNRSEDLVFWRNPTRIPYDNPTRPGRCYYNASIVLHTPGTAPALWEKFDPTTPDFRDEQWYTSALCGPDIPHWTGEDGVYRLAREDTPGSGVDGYLPENAKIVFFPGSNGKSTDPKIAERNPWIALYQH